MFSCHYFPACQDHIGRALHCNAVECLVFKIIVWRLSRWFSGKPLNANSENLNLILGAPLTKGENGFLQAVLKPPLTDYSRPHALTHTHFKKKLFELLTWVLFVRRTSVQFLASTWRFRAVSRSLKGSRTLFWHLQALSTQHIDTYLGKNTYPHKIDNFLFIGSFFVRCLFGFAF